MEKEAILSSIEMDTSFDLSSLPPEMELIKIAGNGRMDLRPLCRLENLRMLDLSLAPNVILPYCLKAKEDNLSLLVIHPDAK